MNMQRRSERGSGEGFFIFLFCLWAWWMVILFLVILPPTYDSEKNCLEEWTKCDKVSETWEPTDEAEES